MKKILLTLVISAFLLISTYAQVGTDIPPHKIDAHPRYVPSNIPKNGQFYYLLIKDGKGKDVLTVTKDSAIIVGDSALAIKELVNAVLLSARRDQEIYEKLNVYAELLAHVPPKCFEGNKKEMKEALRKFNEVRKKWGK